MQRGVSKKIDFFFGEIDGRLDMHPQLGQRLGQLMHASGKLAFERTQRGTRCTAAGGINEIRNRFGLGEIELAVEVGALRELTGLRTTRAQFKHPRQ